MKKILFLIAFVAISLGMVTYVFAKPNPSPDYEQCTNFRNVSATLVSCDNGSGIKGKFQNHNDHAVMVFWEVRAYNKAGRQVTMGQGQVQVSGNGSEYTYCMPTEGLYGWGIKIHDCK